MCSPHRLSSPPTHPPNRRPHEIYSPCSVMTYKLYIYIILPWIFIYPSIKYYLAHFSIYIYI